MAGVMTLILNGNLTNPPEFTDRRYNLGKKKLLGVHP